MKFHFANSKLREHPFITKILIGKYPILKSRGGKDPCHPLSTPMLENFLNSFVTSLAVSKWKFVAHTAYSAQGRIQPISLGGATSVMFGSQVSSPVHFCKRDEVYFTTLLWQNNLRQTGLISRMLFSELHKIMVKKVTFVGFRGGRSPPPKNQNQDLLSNIFTFSDCIYSSLCCFSKNRWCFFRKFIDFSKHSLRVSLHCVYFTERCFL